MSSYYKEKPGDIALLKDDNADPLDRAAAMSRLAHDLLYDLEPEMAKLLNHPHESLRGEAIRVLVGRWKRTAYFDKAFEMLRNDPEWNARCDAVYALGSWARFAKAPKEEVDRVVRLLVDAFLKEEDDMVQKSYYRELLDILVPGSRRSREVPDYFDRDRDVDWELLKPYMPREASL